MIYYQDMIFSLLTTFSGIIKVQETLETAFLGFNFHKNLKK
jgi:hypothetical protein